MDSHYEGQGELNIEKLNDIIPRHLTSRVSLFNLINEAEEAGILGTVWNEWETNWTGVETDVQTTGAFGTGIRPWWLDDNPGFEFDFGTTTTTKEMGGLRVTHFSFVVPIRYNSGRVTRKGDL